MAQWLGPRGELTLLRTLSPHRTRRLQTENPESGWTATNRSRAHPRIRPIGGIELRYGHS